MDCLVIFIMWWTVFTHNIFLPALSTGGCEVNNPCPQETIMFPAMERVWEVTPEQYERIRRTHVVWYNGLTFDCVEEFYSTTPDFLSLEPYEDEFYIVKYEQGWWNWSHYQEEPSWWGE